MSGKFGEICTHLQSFESKQAPRRPLVYPQNAVKEQAILPTQLSSAPKALPSLFLQLREERAISKGAIEAAGGGRKAQAGNSFPEAPQPWFVVIMSAGRVAGPRASRGPARETVSALRAAATLPCPVGPSSWRHLHEISRTRRSGCPVCRAPPSPRLSGWGTPPRSRRSLFPPPFSFPHHRKRRRRRRQ